MKNLLIGICLVFLGIFGCKDKESNPCLSHNRVDLIGYWVSCDSSLSRNNGEYKYLREYLEIKENDTMYIHKIAYPFIEFTWQLLPCDTLDFTYTGRPMEVLPQKPYGHHKIILSASKDTLEIDGITNSFPSTKFNKFYKMK